MALPELTGDLKQADLFAVYHEGETFKYSMFSFLEYINAKLTAQMQDCPADGKMYVRVRKPGHTVGEWVLLPTT